MKGVTFFVIKRVRQFRLVKQRKFRYGQVMWHKFRKGTNSNDLLNLDLRMSLWQLNPYCYSFCSRIALMSKTQFVPLTYLLNISLLIPAIHSHMYYCFAIYLLQVFTILFDKYKLKLLFLISYIYIFFYLHHNGR
jgi:hypothetical protein